MTERRFVNHPGAKEAPAVALEYHPEEDHNPCLRGLPLVAGSFIVGNLQFAQKYIWSNAKFGEPRHAAGLDQDVPWRLLPNVIPVGEKPHEGILPLDSEDLTTPAPAALPGRFNSVADYHALYKSGTATPLDVAEALLPLIQRGPHESKYAVAWTETNVEEVIASARASTHRWASGKPLGVLDGVPFGVKADTKVAGYVSTMGMKVDKKFPYFNKPETETAWPALKMIEAGAIMMGKMNQHEIGMDTTGLNPITGTATNWFNPGYFPGGSSSGAGSALSAGLVPITIGTDSGGSMRIPPSFCGVYGLKPTFNRTMSASTSVCVVGPMTSTVLDLIVAYRIMSQPNPSDDAQSLLAQSIPPSISSSSAKYIGICQPWLARSDPQVLEVFNSTLQYLTSSLGYIAVDISLPYLREGQLAHAAICLSEAATDAQARHPADWLAPLNHPNRILIAGGSHTPASDYLKYSQIRQVIMSHLAWLWGKYPGMLILTPTTPMVGWPIHPGDQKYGCSDGNKSIRNMTYCWYANMAGAPAVTVPGGFADAPEGNGHNGGRLAVGVMAMGEWGEEERLLGWAREVEKMVEGKGAGREKSKEWVDVIGLAKEGNHAIMVYKWEKHKEILHRLYVEEKKPLDEVVQIMRRDYQFMPSRRAYQGAFSRWKFPNKQNPAYKNEQLVARIKELWEQNYNQRDMLRILNEEEGYDIGEREVQRIRTRHNLLLREVAPQDLDEFVAHRQAEREQKRRQLEQEAQERWATKKRRRHTKPYGVLPADPPCPPRFPSETTLSEAKEILQLDAPAYATIREKFMNICNNAGVTKKTICGPDRWEQLKDQLVRESMHLRAALWDPDNAEQKKLAVEIIANDVTKRIRTMNRKMTVVEAKSVLGLNPIQGRDIRAEMYNILVAERFTAKLEEGVERCRELRQRWINGNEILREIVEAEGRDPDWERKMKAVNVLARDAERRYQDDIFPAQHQQQQQQQPAQTNHQGTLAAVSAPPQVAATPSSSSSLIAVYFRLHTATRVLFPDAPVQWIHPLASRAFNDVREGATRKTPGAMCFQVEGIIKDGQGGELPLPVTDDMELQAYLDHVQGHGAPTFNVHLVPGL
ncbi:glutamyl-tRNA amidotransferase subunit A [Cladorrhinum sp. PSN259]|nr:glutamyl-tRNA amidotransferase subunit A [Cladorrhinum sp. PSN259]